ncbi:MAG TPA: ABATE domain-containing protein [Caulobacteraceae bacterium]|nr:ABATE domain-containing protein [Caulobacteraceae bacterium]
MTAPRPAPLLIADDVSLDFLNTIASPAGAPIEWLASGEDLLAWLTQTGLVPDDVVAAMRRATKPAELDGVAAQARDLREWFRSFVRAHKGAPLTPAALSQLAPLNQLLARDERYDALTPDPAGGGGLALETRRRWREPTALLLPIAHAMAELIATADFTRVKACENPSCTLVFHDKSHRGGRRWCSMAVCGNRAKQAAHRHRMKAAAS